MTYADMLKDTALFRLDKRSTRGDTITIATYVDCLLEREGNELSPVPNGLKQRVMGFNCTKEISHLGKP